MSIYETKPVPEPEAEPEPAPEPEPEEGAAGGGCRARRAARAFVERHLQLDEAYLDPAADRCFCEECAGSETPKVVSDSGPTPFVVPRGWVQLGLAPTPRAKAMSIESEWSASFHGVKSIPVLRSILNGGGLMKPGDTLLGGDVLHSEKCGAREDSVFYTSPTVRYAGLKFYAEPQPRSLADPTVVEPFAHDGGQWAACIALQCRQRPGSFRAQPETMGYSSQWDRRDLAEIFEHVDLEGIEWLSSESPAAIPEALLIRPYLWGRDEGLYSCAWMDGQMEWAQQERLAQVKAKSSHDLSDGAEEIVVPNWDVAGAAESDAGGVRTGSSQPLGAVRNEGSDFLAPEPRVKVCGGDVCSVYVKKRVAVVVVLAVLGLLVLTLGGFLGHHALQGPQLFPDSSLDLTQQGEHDRLQATFLAGLCSSHRWRCVPDLAQLEDWLSESSCAPSCLDKPWVKCYTSEGLLENSMEEGWAALNAAAFHDACDEFEVTLSLGRNGFRGHLFGGFAEHSWGAAATDTDDNGIGYVNAPGDWVFRLAPAPAVRGEPKPGKHHHQLVDPRYFPTWGERRDNPTVSGGDVADLCFGEDFLGKSPSCMAYTFTGSPSDPVCGGAETYGGAVHNRPQVPTTGTDTQCDTCSMRWVDFNCEQQQVDDGNSPAGPRPPAQCCSD